MQQQAAKTQQMLGADALFRGTWVTTAHDLTLVAPWNDLLLLQMLRKKKRKRTSLLSENVFLWHSMSATEKKKRKKKWQRQLFMSWVKNKNVIKFCYFSN